MLLSLIFSVISFDPAVLYQLTAFLVIIVSFVSAYFKIINKQDVNDKDTQMKFDLVHLDIHVVKENHNKLENKVSASQDKVEQRIMELENKMEQRHSELTEKVDKMPGEIAAIFKNLVSKGN